MDTKMDTNLARMPVSRQYAVRVGEVIYTYTRAHAIADGSQVDVTKLAQEAGIRFPVFLTRAVYDAYVTVPPTWLDRMKPGGYGTY